MKTQSRIVQAQPENCTMGTGIRFAGIALGLGLLLQSGCTLLLVGGGAAAGIGGYAYAEGDLTATESAPLANVLTATEATLKELEFPITSQTKDALSGSFVARTAQDKRIEIKL